MIFLKVFQFGFAESPVVDQEHALRVATATLLIEVMKADFVVQPSELGKLRQLLAEQYALSATELDDLLAEAGEEADRMVSIQHVTRLLNEQLDHSMKRRVIEMMWHIVFADGDKDRYEEHLIRQVAELLYLSHAEFIQARHKAEFNA